MNLRPAICLLACAALSGCVIGYGHCLFLDPARVSLTGTLHFRSYKVGADVERVAVLSADHSQYVYAPAESHLCRMASDFQLSGWTDYPPSLTDGTRVSVGGSLVQSTSRRQHTHFLIKLRTLVPLTPPPRPVPSAHSPPAH